MGIQFSEYVSLGHPDKVADYISEYILDRLIEQDKNTRYALEVQIKDNNVTLGGEITTNAECDFDKWVKDAIEDVGYTRDYVKYWGDENTINPEKLNIVKYISKQSNDISQGVANNGWGDQGIMFGLAVNSPETDYMPLDFYLAKQIGVKLYESGVGGLDIKTQVVTRNDKVLKVIVAIPMLEDATDKVKEIVQSTISGDYQLIINGTGKYIKHASMGDCGTTGRKLAVDFYGGNCNVGGGSAWTKDGTKADLTLNLYARMLALNYMRQTGLDYVKTGIECCIGRKDITVVYIDRYGNEIKSDVVEITPIELINKFQLDKPIYADLCKYGLFSRIK